MKKGIVMMLVAFTCTLMQAQDNAAARVKSKEVKMTPEQRAQKAVDRLNTIVSLSTDQQQKTYALALDRVAKMKALKAKYKDNQDSDVAKQERKTLRKEFKQQVKAILTPEQITKLKAHHKANHPKKGGNKPKKDMKAEPADKTDDAIPDVE